MKKTADNKLLVPLALPRLSVNNDEDIFVLAGDVGGTKTNLALFKTGERKLKMVEAYSYPSGEYDSFIKLMKKFFSENKTIKPHRICIGVAGPVIKGKADMTNLSWTLDSEEIREATAVQEVTIINDLEATAYGLAGLTNEDMFVIREGDMHNAGNIAIIAPGTGLGEAGLFWDGKNYHPFATEGGHCDFSPRTQDDFELRQFLQKKVGVVSWEHLVSGPGIFNIYEFLRDEKKVEEPAALKEEFEEAKDDTAVISLAATQDKYPICRQAMRLLVRYLAHESCNLVLKMKATGGLYLGGGIPPKIIHLLLEERFYTHYRNCDRMQELVDAVPIKVILNDKAALIGAAYYGAYGPQPIGQSAKK